MELVKKYNQIHLIERVHYITMESVINEVTAKYRGEANSPMSQQLMKYDLEEHMQGRGLNKYFQLELTFKDYTVGIKVHERNKYMFIPLTESCVKIVRG